MAKSDQSFLVAFLVLAIMGIVQLIAAGFFLTICYRPKLNLERAVYVARRGFAIKPLLPVAKPKEAARWGISESAIQHRAA